MLLLVLILMAEQLVKMLHRFRSSFSASQTCDMTVVVPAPVTQTKMYGLRWMLLLCGGIFLLIQEKMILFNVETMKRRLLGKRKEYKVGGTHGRVFGLPLLIICVIEPTFSNNLRHNYSEEQRSRRSLFSRCPPHLVMDSNTEIHEYNSGISKTSSREFRDDACLVSLLLSVHHLSNDS